MKYLAPILLLACGGIRPQFDSQCQTACGMRFLGEFQSNAAYPDNSTGWNCEAFQIIERSMLAQFPKVNDPRFKDVCEVVSTWTVSMHEKAFWKESGFAFTISGLTDCQQHHSIISNSPSDRSTLPHEIAHAVQNCTPNDCTHPGDDAHHACWVENGIYRALVDVQTEVFQRMPAELFLRKDGG